MMEYVSRSTHSIVQAVVQSADRAIPRSVIERLAAREGEQGAECGSAVTD